jgi:dsDNA-binding SOS-regulon protein
MAKPSNRKDVMKLTGMIAALGPFISKLGEKGLPFFKLLKKADKFVWDDKAQKAFEALKESLTTPLIMTPSIPKEALLLYISATTNVVSTILVTEREEEGQVLTDKRRIPLRSASVWTLHLFHHGIPKVLVNPRSKGITSVQSTFTH